MGQKVNPKGFRLAVRRDWESRWFANKGDYAKSVNEDYRIREFIREKLKAAAVPRIFIERAGQRIRVKIYTARPGVVIGQKGAALETLKAMSMGADGVKIQVSGRLGGAEIARTEWQRKGRIPLHTLRENIDYGFTEANTVYGKIGVKCWLCLKSEDNI